MLQHVQPHHLTAGKIAVTTPDLVRAYLKTQYRLSPPHELTLRIGETNGALASLLQNQNVLSAAYVTAWNPLSQVSDIETNKAANERLCATISELGLMALPGNGVDPDGAWPGEESFLILGASLDQAEALARRYHQNAFVWVDRTAIPVLALVDETSVRLVTTPERTSV
ncbi:hypothetical protein ATE48_09135 [Candidatus Viadribacter manganicus]|uniref:DUF3293 domain-containing protein n=2 Tax=Candidatus Viadribacter manganicus TaxID=1759059 RepID=A0A1B1AHN3_9PROT|nr:hypothetical protein ATE48_09135 [Candidatus Viadribacter manganicus]